MQLRRILPPRKKLVVIFLTIVILGAAAAALYFKNTESDPIPQEVRTKVSHSVIFPSTSKARIDDTSYTYLADQKVLKFNVQYSGKTVVFSQQPTPENIGSGEQAYYPALGIRPYAQFNSPLGPVALAKFWQSGTLEPAGQSAILVAGGTMLTAHSDKGLSNQEWKELFENLKISK